MGYVSSLEGTNLTSKDPQTPTTTEAAGALIVYDITNRSILPSRDGMDGMRNFRNMRPEKGWCLKPMGAFTGNTWVNDYENITSNLHKKPNRFGPKMKMCYSRFAFIYGRYPQKHVKLLFLMQVKTKKHHGHPGILFRIINGCWICWGLFGMMHLFFFPVLFVKARWFLQSLGELVSRCQAQLGGLWVQISSIYRVCRGWKTTKAVI